MTDETSDIIIEHLRAIRGDTQALRKSVADLTHRVGSLEQSVAHLHSDFAALSVRVDGSNERMERIEQRLGLIDPAIPA